MQSRAAPRSFPLEFFRFHPGQQETNAPASGGSAPSLLRPPSLLPASYFRAACPEFDKPSSSRNYHPLCPELGSTSGISSSTSQNIPERPAALEIRSASVAAR